MHTPRTLTLAALTALMLAGCTSLTAVPQVPTPTAEPLERPEVRPEAAPFDLSPRSSLEEAELSAQNVAPADFVLFIRGIDPFYSPAAHRNGSVVPQGCDVYFRDLNTFVFNQHPNWAGKVRTVGFYDKQRAGSCTVNLKDVRPPRPYSSNLLLENQTFTNDTSIVQLGQRLAWWIHTHYTSKGYTVSLVGHSLGGLVARTAVGASGKDSRFPPALAVKSLVTLNTPNNGASFAAYANLVTWSCNAQCMEMNRNSAFLNTLNSTWDSGNSGVKYRFNLGGSADGVVGDVRSSAIGGTGGACYYTNPTYDHGSILTDTSTLDNAQLRCWDDRRTAYSQSPYALSGQRRSLSLTMLWATTP